MPVHTASNNQPKKKSSAGGGGPTRSAVTGRALGRAARRSAAANATHIDQYLDIIMDPQTTADDLIVLHSRSNVLGRVERMLGGSQLSVTLQTVDGSRGATVPVGIAGALRFRGKAATKSDASNCMLPGDLILIIGGQASGKFPPATALAVKAIFAKRGLSIRELVPGAESAAEDDDEVFDRTEEREAEEEARKAALRPAAGGGGGGSGGLLDAVADAVAVAAAATDAKVAIADGREDFMEPLVKKAPKKASAAAAAGPSRRERRAASAAVEEVEEGEPAWARPSEGRTSVPAAPERTLSKWEIDAL